MVKELYFTPKILFQLGMSTSILALMISTSAAQAFPQEGSVTSGAISIEQVNKTTTVIRQESARGIIDWRNFDLNSNETISFKQPDRNSITVNRIRDSKTKTTLDGSIDATGNVVIINPNGVLFGENFHTDVNGLVATTSDLADDEEFMKDGAIRFKQSESYNSDLSPSVENDGTITAREAGLVGLISPNVQNRGTIIADLGNVTLASGNVATIDFAGDGLIQLDISKTPMVQEIVHQGKIISREGHVVITAAQAKDVVDGLITVNGYVEAKKVKISTKGILPKEKIESANNQITISGSVRADGGDVEVLSDRILLTSESKIDVSNSLNGGHINIGRNQELAAATYVHIDKGALLDASATDKGENSGRIDIFSLDRTRFLGRADAYGGVKSVIAIGSKNELDFQGSVDLTAYNGEFGNLYLDSGDVALSYESNADTSWKSTFYGSTNFEPSLLNVSSLQDALQNAHVTVTANPREKGEGNIFLRAALSWEAPTTLSLVSKASFFNEVGDNSLNAKNGRWLSYSQSPEQNKRNGLNGDFRRYGCAYGTDCPTLPEKGNGFLYAVTPTLSATPSYTNMTYGDSFDPNNYSYELSGYLDDDQPYDIISGSLNGLTNYTSTKNAGTHYAINYSSGSLLSEMGYNIVYENNSSAINVLKKNITARIGNLSRAYGDANPTLTWSSVTWNNLVNGQNGSVLDTISFSSPTAIATSNAGTIHNINISSFYDNNYNLTGFTAGKLIINKRDVTASWNGSLARAYGDTNPTVTPDNFTFNNLVNNDSNSAITSTANFHRISSLADAGSYSVGSFFASTNYNVLNTPSTNLIISKRNITANISDTTRIYGDTNPNYTWNNVTWNNLANGQTGSVLDNVTFSAPTAVATSNAGTIHNINISSFNDNNYNLTSFAPGKLSITKSDITVQADNKFKKQGEINPVLTYQVMGLKNNDSKSLINLALGTNALRASPMGVYDINMSVLGSSTNYNIAHTIPGKLTIGAPKSIPAVVERSVSDQILQSIKNHETTMMSTNSYKNVSESIAVLPMNDIKSTLEKNTTLDNKMIFVTQEFLDKLL